MVYNFSMNRSAVNQNISVDFIEELKNDPDTLLSFLEKENTGTIIYVLGKFGKIKDGASKEPLIRVLKNSDPNVRVLALKNLAKIGDMDLLHIFFRYTQTDDSNIVRREATSAIGRMRNESAIPILNTLLGDDDPEVAMQAILGLLPFSDRSDVKNLLHSLSDHPNEMIRDVIDKKISVSVNSRADDVSQHSQSPDFLKNVVVNGDVEEIMKCVPDDSLHLTFTSPPYYNARDYSIYKSYGEYLNFLERVFKEVHRITKEGRFFALNTSPIIIPRIGRQYSSRRYPIPYDIHPLLTAMGWEFIDDIVWVKPEASVKNRNAGFLQHRKPLAYKPNSVTEMVMVYRKKTDRLIDWNIRQYSEDAVENSRVTGEYETTNVWRIDPSFDRVHSAVFPAELCERIIRYYSFEGDLVFDPFAGSGTVAKTIMRSDLKRNFFLSEKEKLYADRIKEGMNQCDGLFNTEHKSKFFDLKEFKKWKNR